MSDRVYRFGGELGAFSEAGAVSALSESGITASVLVNVSGSDLVVIAPPDVANDVLNAAIRKVYPDAEYSAGDETSLWLGEHISNRDNLQASADAALLNIAAFLVQANADLTSWPTMTTAQKTEATKQILVRQIEVLSLVRKVIKYVRYL